MSPTAVKVSQQEYAHVSTSEESFDPSAVEKALTAPRHSSLSRFTKIASLIAASIVGLVTIFALGYALGYHNRNDTSLQDDVLSGNCTEPYMRKEWRSLSTKEKKDYISAFQCFIDSPSQLGMNGSLYDDFSWAHNTIAHNTHGRAPFLTWHRRFIFVYEQQLRQTCKYNGALPFWDWSLDWEDPPSSPVFDSKHGFGGDGDPEAPKFGAAHCVTDTPFKNLKPSWAGTKYDPHCLTRWFDDDDWFGHYISPLELEEIMQKPTYEEFFIALEMRAHDIIPTGVRGDFTAFTAPNDPLFYLHHSQLDRIWWLWQLRDKANRINDYGGPKDDFANVTLADSLPLAGLAEDITVREIMNTETGELCYRYGYL